MSDLLTIDLSVLITEPADEYHAKANEYLSSHQLIDYIQCPLLYIRKQSGLIPEKDSSAFILGRAAHTRILEGRDTYESSYAFGGPINPTTGKPYGNTTQKFNAWAAEQNRPVLSFDQVDLIENLASGVARNDLAVELLLYGQAEGVVRASYCGLPCQIRIDWLHPHQGIVDLKTCEDLDRFERDAKRYRYDNQLGFYQAVLAEKIDQFVPVHIVAIEKREPFRCGVWLVSEDTLFRAQTENQAAIERLKESRKSDFWPTGYEVCRLLDFT